MLLTVQEKINEIKTTMGTFLANDRAIFTAKLGLIAAQVKAKSKKEKIKVKMLQEQITLNILGKIIVVVISQQFTSKKKGRSLLDLIFRLW